MKDGESLISIGMLEIVGSVNCVRTLVGVNVSVSMGTELVLVFPRSMTELLMSGRSDRTVSEEITSETALGVTSVAEGSVGSSVMICEIVVCVSKFDVIDGSRSVVSARTLVSEMSDASEELSTTIELMVETSSLVELVPRSPRPVSSDSGNTVADGGRSEMVADGPSVITGRSSVTNSGLKSVADGIA